MEDSNDKLYGVLAYIGILWLVGLIAGKTQFAKFHTNQGLVLFIAEAVISIAASIIMIIPIVGLIIGGLLYLVDVACLVFAILGIVNVVNGQMKELPIIGKIHILDKAN